jgi:hypothetical protein
LSTNDLAGETMDQPTVATGLPSSSGGSPAAWAGFSALLVVAVASAKLVVGDSLTLSSLYLLPVVITAWHAGRGPAITIAGLAALLSQLVHGVGGERPLWAVTLDLLVLLAACGTALALVGRYRAALDERAHTADLLEGALANVRTLRGTWTMCRGCKSIRATEAEWEPVEDFVTAHSLAGFVLTRCPACKHRSDPPTAS